MLPDAIEPSLVSGRDDAHYMERALAQARQFAQLLKPLGLAPSRGFDELVHDLVDR